MRSFTLAFFAFLLFAGVSQAIACGAGKNGQPADGDKTVMDGGLGK